MPVSISSFSRQSPVRVLHYWRLTLFMSISRRHESTPGLLVRYTVTALFELYCTYLYPSFSPLHYVAESKCTGYIPSPRIINNLYIIYNYIPTTNQESNRSLDLSCCRILVPAIAGFIFLPPPVCFLSPHSYSRRRLISVTPHLAALLITAPILPPAGSVRACVSQEATTHRMCSRGSNHSSRVYSPSTNHPPRPKLPCSNKRPSQERGACQLRSFFADW